MNSSTEACNHPVLDKHGPPGHLPLDEPLQPTDPRIEEQAVNMNPVLKHNVQCDSIKIRFRWQR